MSNELLSLSKHTAFRLLHIFVGLPSEINGMHCWNDGNRSKKQKYHNTRRKNREENWGKKRICHRHKILRKLLLFIQDNNASHFLVMFMPYFFPESNVCSISCSFRYQHSPRSSRDSLQFLSRIVLLIHRSFGFMDVLHLERATCFLLYWNIEKWKLIRKRLKINPREWEWECCVFVSRQSNKRFVKVKHEILIGKCILSWMSTQWWNSLGTINTLIYKMHEDVLSSAGVFASSSLMEYRHHSSPYAFQ